MPLVAVYQMPPRLRRCLPMPYTPPSASSVTATVSRFSPSASSAVMSKQNGR